MRRGVARRASLAHRPAARRPRPLVRALIGRTLGVESRAGARRRQQCTTRPRHARWLRRAPAPASSSSRFYTQSSSDQSANQRPGSVRRRPVRERRVARDRSSHAAGRTDKCQPGGDPRDKKTRGSACSFGAARSRCRRMRSELGRRPGGSARSARLLCDMHTTRVMTAAFLCRVLCGARLHDTGRVRPHRTRAAITAITLGSTAHWAGHALTHTAHDLARTPAGSGGRTGPTAGDALGRVLPLKCSCYRVL